MKLFIQVLLFLLVISILALFLLVRPSVAQNTSTLAYSASNCVPGSNGSWGNTDGDPDGFFFSRQGGAFVQTEPNGEYLYCPVLYNYTSSNNVYISVAVYDASPNTQLKVSLYGRPIVASFGAIELMETHTTNSFTGNTGLILAGKPRENVDDLIFLWLTIFVPNRSAVIGYVVTQEQ